MLVCFLQVAYQNEGLEAIVFTADGDMRQALNNLQVGSLSCGQVYGIVTSMVQQAAECLLSGIAAVVF